MDDNNFITSSVCRSLSFVLSIEHGHPTAELQSGSDIVNSWICNSISPSLLNQRHVNSQLLGIKDLNFYLQIFIFAEYIFWWLFSPQEGFPASSQRVSSPATEKHQDICTIPLAAFDPVSWLHRQGCSPSGKEKNCFNTPKAKSSKHPIFGVFFVWINFWKFPHLPIEIMESLVCQHFPFFFSKWRSFRLVKHGLFSHAHLWHPLAWTPSDLSGPSLVYYYASWRLFPRFFWVLMFFESGCDSVGAWCR